MKGPSKIKTANLETIIRAITPSNNHYRDPAPSAGTKLEALWEMGDQLIKLGVTKPHSIGWAIQRETRGLIKRPTVFRSHKIRTVWTSREQLIKDIGRIQRLSYLTEIIPLIDPAQDVRRRLSEGKIAEIYDHACADAPQKFRRYVAGLKTGYSHGRLGKLLDRSKHLKEFEFIVTNFRSLLAEFLKVLSQDESVQRDKLRCATPSEELRSFSNMCISLTTKENIRLYKRLGPASSSSKDQQFRFLYDNFYKMLNRRSDVERARLRRLISAEALAKMSDAMSSLNSEEGVKDFRARQKLAIPL